MKRTLVFLAFALPILVLGACFTVQPTSAPQLSMVESPAAPLIEPTPVTSASTATTLTVESQPFITITVVMTVTLTPTPLDVAASETATQIPSSQPPASTDTPEPTATDAPTDTPKPQPPETPSPLPPTSTPSLTSTATPAPTEGPPPTHTPLPNTVFVRDHSSRSSGSDLIVVGEVTNGSSRPVNNVIVSAAFYDAAGNLIGAAESAALLPQTVQTQDNPFRIRLSNAPAAVSTYELALRWDDFSAHSYDRITIVSQDVDTNNGVTISGELRNDGFSQVSDIIIAATLYDAAGHVVDSAFGHPTVTTLAPGEITTYTITASALPAYDHVVVQAQAILGR